jgi:gp16 family phage-associated protein
MRLPLEKTMALQDHSRKSALLQELARIREDFYQRGESVADWSRLHGFRPNAVYRVLSGQSLAARGNAHKIAVALGIKGSVPSSEHTRGDEKGAPM